MCGRLVLTSSYKEKIKAIFDDVKAESWQPPRYNVTPAQPVPTLKQNLPTQLNWITWGHEQPVRGETKKSRLLINARAETIDKLATFRDAFRMSRCIVLADGFYEWKRSGKGPPQPHFFGMKDQSSLPLAGLLLSNGEQEEGCVIVTTEANSLMHPVHHRMPVIFTPPSARTWLDDETSVDTLRLLMQPHPSDRMTSHPVSQAVNRASAEGAQLIDRVQIIEQTDLF